METDVREAACVAWINACKVSTEQVHSIDTQVLAQTLHFFVPDFFYADANLIDLEDQLDVFFQGDLSTTSSLAPDKFTWLAEVALVAAVNSERSDEAVQAILQLKDEDQHVLKEAMQMYMPLLARNPNSPSSSTRAALVTKARGQRGTPGFLARRQGRSLDPPKTSVSRVSSKSWSSVGSGVLYTEASVRRSFICIDTRLEELQSMGDELAIQTEELTNAEQFEEAGQQRLQLARQNVQDEEQAAQNQRDKLTVFWRTRGDELRNYASTMATTEDELRALSERAKDHPSRVEVVQSEMQEMSQRERELTDQIAVLDNQVANAQHTSSASSDNLADVHEEIRIEKELRHVLQKATQTKQETEFNNEMQEVGLWERINLTQERTQMKVEHIQQALNSLHKSEEDEKNAIAMLEYQRMEIDGIRKRSSLASFQVDAVILAEDGDTELKQELRTLWAEQRRLQTACDDALFEYSSIERSLHQLEEESRVHFRHQLEEERVLGILESEAQEHHRSQLEEENVTRRELPFIGMDEASLMPGETAEIGKMRVSLIPTSSVVGRPQKGGSIVAKEVSKQVVDTSDVYSENLPKTLEKQKIGRVASRLMRERDARADSPTEESDSSLQSTASGTPPSVSTSTTDEPPTLHMVEAAEPVRRNSTPGADPRSKALRRPRVGSPSARKSLPPVPEDDDESDLSKELNSIRAAACTERDTVRLLRTRLTEEEERTKSKTNSKDDLAKSCENQEFDAAAQKQIQRAAKQQTSSDLAVLRQTLQKKDGEIQALVGQKRQREREMKRETTALTRALHEVVLRCHQMNVHHRLALDQRGLK